MSADVRPIRAGIAPESDVAREAIDYVKDGIARYSDRPLAGITFVLHFADGTAESFCYSARAEDIPHGWLVAQAATVLSARGAGEALL